jgi:hypothetical protein
VSRILTSATAAASPCTTLWLLSLLHLVRLQGVFLL